MIIKTPRSRLLASVDVLLTSLAWLALIYLLGKGMLAIVQGQRSGPEVTLFERFLPSAGTLGAYAIVAVVNACVLLLWAKYNELRFRGKDRRAALAQLSSEQVAQSFSMDADTRLSVATSRWMTVHHGAEGQVQSIDFHDAVVRKKVVVREACNA